LAIWGLIMKKVIQRTLFVVLAFPALLGAQAVFSSSPWVDVRAYGAKGNGSTDDTAAIKAAINFACSRRPSGFQPPTVSFPPGDYVVDQTQGSSNATPDLPACFGLHLIGLGNGPIMQFGSPPQAHIGVALGANPSPAAVIAGAATSDLTIENLGIDGYNEALYFTNTSNVTLINDCLRVRTTGMADNTPLKLGNSLWFTMNRGCLQVLGAGSGSVDAMLMVGDGSGGTPDVGIVAMDDVLLVGGRIHYSQRANFVGAVPGVWVFRNMSREASAQDFIYISNDTGNPGELAVGQVSAITIDGLLDADETGGATSVVNVNVSGIEISGININHAKANSGNAIVVSGKGDYLETTHVFGCSVYCATGIVDGSGKPLGGAARQNENGFDYSVLTGDDARLRTDVYDIDSVNNLRGPALRLSASGDKYSSLALDPAQGFLLADGVNNGYTAQITQNEIETLDVGFSRTQPPTNLSASVASGGTLAVGTYFYFVAPIYAGTNCSSHGAPSLASGAVTTSRANQAVTIAWTPSADGVTTLTGYCVIRNTSQSTDQGGGLPALFVPGAHASGAIDTGSNFSDGAWGQFFWAINSMVPVHRFTANSFGVNTIHPITTLDVNGASTIRGHVNQGATGQFAGTCAMSSGTSCIITLTSAYANTPGCLVTVQSAVVIAGGCTVTGTKVTVSAASVNSSVWAAMLFGNPN
jgi:Pectate lyase superfamily protein